MPLVRHAISTRVISRSGLVGSQRFSHRIRYLHSWLAWDADDREHDGKDIAQATGASGWIPRGCNAARLRHHLLASPSTHHRYLTSDQTCTSLDIPACVCAQEADRAGDAIKASAAALRAALAEAAPAEPSEAELAAAAGGDIEAPMFFTEPRQLLAILGELETDNLFLIQNAQEVEEALDSLETSYRCALPTWALGSCSSRGALRASVSLPSLSKVAAGSLMRRLMSVHVKDCLAWQDPSNFVTSSLRGIKCDAKCNGCVGLPELQRY